MQVHLKAIAFTFLMASSAASCRPPASAAPDSRLTTLEEVEKGQKDLNKSCRGDHPGLLARVASGEATAVKAVAGVSTALPEVFQKNFIAMGGRILLSEDGVREHCPAGTTSCYTFSYDGGAGNFRSLDVHLTASTAAISRNLVRLFGYMQAQVFSNYGLKGDKVVPTRESGLLDAKAAIATGFLQDLASRRRLSAGLRYFSSTDRDTIKASVGGKDFSLLAADLDRDTTLGFMEMVFAEFFDARFCSDKEHKVLTDKYPMAAAAGAAYIDRLLRRANGRDSTRGFALAAPYDEAGWSMYQNYAGQEFGSYYGQGEDGQSRYYAGSMVQEATGNYYNLVTDGTDIGYGPLQTGSGGLTSALSNANAGLGGCSMDCPAPGYIGD